MARFRVNGKARAAVFISHSSWVEREWQAKYWKEIHENKVMIIPVLLEDCNIPILLQTKKYADFRTDYRDGLETLLGALLPRHRKRRLVHLSTWRRRNDSAR
jgi:hypothetical protein